MVDFNLSDIDDATAFAQVTRALATLRKYDMITPEQHLAMLQRFLATRPELRATLENSQN